MQDDTSTPQDEAFDRAVRREPYFTVFTAQKFLRRNFNEEREREFFETGERYVESTLELIEARFIPEFTPVSVLEYGCGVGRLALPFARRVASVLAVDRSPAMLDVAREHARRCGIQNIEFRTPAGLFGSNRKFDLVNCYLVFQRMKATEGLALLRNLLSCIGAGGIGVFHFPYRTHAPRHLEALRRLRARLPMVNGLVNVLRRKPFDEPLGVRHRYELDDIFSVLQAASINSQYVMFEDPDGLSSAMIFVEGPASFTSLNAPLPGPLPIDVKQLIETTSVDELNQAAERYFASLDNWEFHLGKPFSSAEEVPQLLINAGTLLHGLRIAPGMDVLEFGAGTGWLSRSLTQLGCRVVLLDVSDTALRIAEELYARVPVIGQRPVPRFVRFDGRCMDVADGSIDRIVAFDAFHHAPNPDAVLREFSRILKPGGVAGFMEPGPRHSLAPTSQFEMRTYRVVESDIDVHAIWRMARSCGFRDIRLLVFHEPPFHVSLAEYEDLLAGGETCARWMTSTRGFLRHVRGFLLFREGVERLDSRIGRGLLCDIRARLVDGAVRTGDEIAIDVDVTNTGAAAWAPSNERLGGVRLGLHLYDASRRLLKFDYCAVSFGDGREVEPNESVRCRIKLNGLPAGQYLLELDCVASQVTWFSQVGSRPETLAVHVMP